MKSFLSYVAKEDSVLAERIKEYLDRYSFNCFLAHEDIPPQSNWSQELLKNLDECDLFLALLTPKYKTSFYCQQEVGYVCCRGIEILPILISADPMGLIGHIQGVKFNEGDLENSCWKIVKHVANNIQSISGPVIDELIEEFGSVNRYDVAREKAEKILNQFDFSSCQANKVMEHIASNGQIYDSRTAKAHILVFIDKYGEHLDPKMIENYKQRSSQR